MTIRNYTAGGTMLPQLDCDSKDKAIERLVQALASDGVVADQNALLADILTRESVGDTAVGGGVAIPHVRSPHVRDPRLAVATLRRPVPHRGSDGIEVDVLFLIVGREEDSRTMLRLLARLVRNVRVDGFVTRLRAAATAEELLVCFGDPAPNG